MATIKSFSDLQQSKKLAEILPIESADMCWTRYIDNGDVTSIHATVNYGIVTIDYPCWSLSSLLDLLKDRIIFGGNSPEGWFCCYTIKNPIKTLTIYEDSLVDACYEMILKLHELKML